MTPRFTTATSLSLLKLYWQAPHSIGNTLANVIGQIAGMRCVASAARSASSRLVYMQIVQVHIAISEVGKV